MIVATDIDDYGEVPAVRIITGPGDYPAVMLSEKCRQSCAFGFLYIAVQQLRPGLPVCANVIHQTLDSFQNLQRRLSSMPENELRPQP
ncbi:MAG: hypothetical protein ACE5GA_05220 [Candidatus Zixiibacteriota bacterium]